MFERAADFKLDKEQNEKFLSLDGVQFFEEREEPQGNELNEWVQRKIARAKAIEQLGSVANLENKQFEGEVAHNFMRHVREIPTFDLHCNEPFHMENKKNQAWTAIETSLNAKCKVIRFITLRNSREVSIAFLLENSVTMRVESGLKFVNMKKFEDDVRQFFLGPHHLYDFITKTIWAHIDEYAATPQKEEPVEKTTEVVEKPQEEEPRMNQTAMLSNENRSPSISSFENRSNSSSYRGGREQQQQRGGISRRGNDRNYQSQNQNSGRPFNAPMRRDNSNFKSSSQDIRKIEALEHAKKATQLEETGNIPKPQVEASENIQIPPHVEVAETVQKTPEVEASENAEKPSQIDISEDVQKTVQVEAAEVIQKTPKVEESEIIQKTPQVEASENVQKNPQVETTETATPNTSTEKDAIIPKHVPNQNKENNRKVGGSFGAKKPALENLSPSVATLMTSFVEAKETTSS